MQIRKGDPFSSFFFPAAIYLKIVLINIKIFNDHDANNLGSAQLVQSCMASLHFSPLFAFINCSFRFVFYLKLPFLFLFWQVHTHSFSNTFFFKSL